MDKYIIVTTLCNKEEIANKIIDTLLEKKLVAGSQVFKVPQDFKNLKDFIKYHFLFLFNTIYKAAKCCNFLAFFQFHLDYTLFFYFSQLSKNKKFL